MNAQNAAAAAPTTGVVPAAADEVSALTAAQFAAHAQMYQAVSAQAAAIHEMFVNTLATSSGSYAATEAANADRLSAWLIVTRGLRTAQRRDSAAAWATATPRNAVSTPSTQTPRLGFGVRFTVSAVCSARWPPADGRGGSSLGTRLGGCASARNRSATVDQTRRTTD